MLMAALLSQYRHMGSFIGKPTLESNIFNHSNSHIPWVMNLNSTLALDLATPDCFLLLQVIRLPSTNEQ